VRGRTRDALLEGAVAVASGSETTVDPARLASTTYAQLVRKGHGEILDGVSGWFAGPAVQTAIVSGASPCYGALAGWTWVRSDITLSPRAALCRGAFSNDALSAHTDLLAADLRVAKAVDLRRNLTLDLGVTAGVEVLHESFDTRGSASPRTTPVAHVDAGIGAIVPLRGRYFLTSELAAQTHFFRIEDQDGTRSFTARFALRGIIAVGAWR
jgi:hypothetical protein